MKSKTSKTAARVAWIRANREAIIASRIPTEGSAHNAAHRRGMSGGGWGYWVWALREAEVDCEAMRHWSGCLPTPSTSINGGIAAYIAANAPAEIR
jgi:hypothetical protein